MFCLTVCLTVGKARQQVWEAGWSPCISTEGAVKDGCLCSADLFFFMQSRTTAYKMVPLTIKVDLSTWINQI